MKILQRVILGFIAALALCALEYIVGYLFLIPVHLGNYADSFYITVSIAVLTWLLLAKKWVIATSFTFFALCFFGPSLFFIVAIIGCSIGQCPVL
jgi:hypothetical protein